MVEIQKGYPIDTPKENYPRVYALRPSKGRVSSRQRDGPKLGPSCEGS